MRKRIIWFLIWVFVALGAWGSVARAAGGEGKVYAVPRLRVGPTMVSGRLGVGGGLSISFLPERTLARWSSVFFNTEEVSWVPKVLFSGWMGTGGDRGAFLGLGGVFRLSDWNPVETSEVPLSSYSESVTIEIVPGVKHVRIDGDSKTGIGLRMGMELSRKIPLWVSVELGPGSPVWGVGLSRSF